MESERLGADNITILLTSLVQPVINYSTISHHITRELLQHFTDGLTLFNHDNKITTRISEEETTSCTIYGVIRPGLAFFFLPYPRRSILRLSRKTKLNSTDMKYC